MSPDQSRYRNGMIALGSVLLSLLGAGWFVLSHFVMETATSDAIGEALGVMLGLLVLFSIVGAFASSGGSHR